MIAGNRTGNRLLLSLCVFAAASVIAPRSHADLQRYVDKPEPAFEWQMKNKSEREQSGDRTYDLEFVSQTWRGEKWRHQLQVYHPSSAVPGARMFLWVTGGSASAQTSALGLELARRMKAPAAFVYHIPNQPLLEGKLWEDDLIAETFVRYLKSGDDSWPLLLVKSVVKAMDALQAFSKKEWSAPVEKFIVAGASKRGWTSWLTAAVDPRVGAIAPAVIDVLNMRAQMSRQIEAFGGYSARLAPYSSRGLLPIPETPAGARLLEMVDPWAYRSRLTMPKLIVNGTNDLYWATDALNLYWDGIPNDKWVLYVPNAGHNLRRKDRPASEQLNDLITGLAAFTRHQINGTAMPRLRWRHESAGGGLRLIIDATPAPRSARLWVARSASSDFRTAEWRPESVRVADGRIAGEVARPEQGRVAFFGELEYEIGGLRYALSTQMRMAH